MEAFQIGIKNLPVDKYRAVEAVDCPGIAGKLQQLLVRKAVYDLCLLVTQELAAQLAKLCLEQLGWKRTTTYTIIKRLGERGILKNENGLVTALVSKDEAQACEIDELVEKAKDIIANPEAYAHKCDGKILATLFFEGSLPTFIAAFTKRQDLSAHELDEVQQMIDRIRRGETQ